MFQYHPFHMVYLSPWPFYTAVLVTSNFFMFVMAMNKMSYMFMLNFFIVLNIVMYNWWRDVNRESFFQGYHTSFVFSNMRYGMLLFIVSEVLFFLSFFWSFFHSSLSPNYELGGVWPPLHSLSINPFDVPLLNTVILLSSGITVTLCHHYVIFKENYLALFYLFTTVFLGFYFTLAQIFEYYQTDFLLSDSAYGSTFFVATGFHGFHVVVGSVFLFFSMLRMSKNYMNFFHHVGLESSIWYWHFVDVVWLYLFMFIYWWVY